jgi:hypothetical protein
VRSGAAVGVVVADLAVRPAGPDGLAARDSVGSRRAQAGAAIGVLRARFALRGAAVPWEAALDAVARDAALPRAAVGAFIARLVDLTTARHPVVGLAARKLGAVSHLRGVELTEGGAAIGVEDAHLTADAARSDQVAMLGGTRPPAAIRTGAASIARGLAGRARLSRGRLGPTHGSGGRRRVCHGAAAGGAKVAATVRAGPARGTLDRAGRTLGAARRWVHSGRDACERAALTRKGAGLSEREAP